MIRFVAIVILSASLSWFVLGYSMLQAQQIVHSKQDQCIVPGSSVHKVYRSMLSILRSDLAQWNEFKDWSNHELPLLTPSIEVHRSKSLANLHDLESVSVCAEQS